MSYTENILIRTRDCDMYGRWRPAAMLEAMQEVATAHCETEGLGRRVLDGLGVAWILSRCRVELRRMPVNGERLSLETYAMPMRHLFFPRAHIIRDADGNVVGGAHGLWLLMDMSTRKAATNPFVRQSLPLEAREAPVAMPGTVHPLDAAPIEDTLLPHFTDFDLNGHVNNTKYMDWCWNALGFDALREGELVAFDINYDGELLPGETVQTSLCRAGERFTFCGCVDGKRRFGVSGQLKSV